MKPAAEDAAHFRAFRMPAENGLAGFDGELRVPARDGGFRGGNLLLFAGVDVFEKNFGHGSNF